jgi:hypothetical protein
MAGSSVDLEFPALFRRFVDQTIQDFCFCSSLVGFRPPSG